MAIHLAAVARSSLLALLAPLAAAQVAPNWLPTFGEYPGAVGPVKTLASVRRPGPHSQPVLLAAAMALGGQPTAWVSGWDGKRWTSVGDAEVAFWNAATQHDFGAGPELVVAGTFTNIGAVPATRVARFDGSVWRSISVLYGDPLALASFAGVPGTAPSLYAGGISINFGPGMGSLNRFDGTQWVSVGSGTSGTVEVLKVLDLGAGPRLVVGGSFTSAGGLPNTRGIAVWDGTSWSALGAGIAGTIYDVTLHDEGSGPRLFVAGDFLNSGAPFVTGVARFNGTTWEDVGLGVGGVARALESYTSGGSSSLYVGGSFTTAGPISASRLARWDGTQWHDIGGAASTVRALESFDPGDGSGTKLYVAGDFTRIGGVARQRIAIWDGSQWSSAGAGLAGAVRATTVWNEGVSGPDWLYVGGSLQPVGAVGRGQVQRWNGDQWESVGFGSIGSVNALEPFDDGSGPALYATGDFSSAGGIPANGIARLRLGNWEPVGAGLGAQRRGFALEVFDSGGGPQLHVCGDKDLLPGAPGVCVARWTGSQWTPLPSQTTGGAFALQTLDLGQGPKLFVGGNFLSVGGVTSPNLIEWNGSTFSAVGNGLNGNCWGLSSFRFQGAPQAELVATGEFSQASGSPASGVAVWNGTSFRALSTQVLSARAYGALGFDDGMGAGERLYVHGEFTGIDGVAAPGVARFDGVQLTPLSPVGPRTDPTGIVFAATVLPTAGEPDRLVLGGSFHVTPSGDSHLALWGSATDAIESYCTAGTSTNGCQATLSALGVAQVDPASTFRIVAGGVEGARSGMVHFGTRGRIATPFKPTSSSVLCVRGPVQRTQVQLSGGNAGNCDGTLDLDWRGYMNLNATALGLPLFAGERFNAQGWYRDPAAPGGASLTDALEFYVLP